MSTVIDDLHIEIPLSWKAVLVKEQHFDWHRKSLYSSDMSLVSGPKVYRWLMHAEGGKDSVYIGESVKFEDRLLQHRLRIKKPAATDKLVNAIVAFERNRGIVELQFLDLGERGFRLNGHHINRWSLGEHEVRLMMENMSIIAARASNLTVINSLRDSAKSRAEKWIMEYARTHGSAAALKLLQTCQNRTG